MNKKRNYTKLEKKVAELEKRVAALEGSVQAQPLNVKVLINSPEAHEELVKNLLSDLQKQDTDL